MVPLGAVPLVAMLFTPVADFDIPWYMDHPAERRALIAECQNDWRLAQSWTCNNAQAAELRSTPYWSERDGGGTAVPIPDVVLNQKSGVLAGDPTKPTVVAVGAGVGVAGAGVGSLTVNVSLPRSMSPSSATDVHSIV